MSYDMNFVVVESETGAVAVLHPEVAKEFNFTAGDPPVSDDVLIRMKAREFEWKERNIPATCEI